MIAPHLEIFVEEPSMEAALRTLVPRMAPALSFEVYTHRSKSQLLARLPNRLRGYKAFLPEGHRILVVIDRDADDCRKLKKQLDAMAAEAGLAPRSAKRKTWSVVNRIAIEELEAWYFGDWAAVRAAYPRAGATTTSQARYRAPDGIKGGTWEAFEKVLQNAGYFADGLRKVEAARAISARMDPARNTSPSFRALRDVILEVAGA